MNLFSLLAFVSIVTTIADGFLFETLGGGEGATGFGAVASGSYGGPAPCGASACPPPTSSPNCPPPPYMPRPEPCPPPPTPSPPIIYTMPPAPCPVPTPTYTPSGGDGLGGTRGETNDCCCKCSDSCRFRRLRRIAGVRTRVANSNPRCNSHKLSELMRTNMIDQTNTGTAKRNIQKAANRKIFGKFSVICSQAEFSYIVNTNFFCQERIGDMSCYAFRQL